MSENNETTSTFTMPAWGKYVCDRIPDALKTKLSFYDMECLFRAFKDWFGVEKPYPEGPPEVSGELKDNPQLLLE